ncbi:hypothetical protein GGI25_003741 [Coemansia spiralis]|uniref:Enoyl reductase (ER) domain-containing protein n=2 Tax=Coemansia TaxID=4863 RepID=A0A9W8KW84_9FUNG|nr:hypothetical protein EDC05_002294 [Coemansia umbellata]KAJ2622486.1 hypothetical protein GGI26_003213 [Coemansia sp. RSA 1358]KAJ2676007.1 hypothetical protein GGI25_003741 [Coemansia spiralis]
MKPGLTVKPYPYKPRSVGGYDVEIKIKYSGICGADIHAIKNDWSNSTYPIVTGHEIVGKVATVGEKVTKFKEGDLVGVGQPTRGGFADAIHVEDSYVHIIPESLNPVYAPPLMCAGLTVFTPMLRKGIKKANRVGIVGIGGLGHLAIQFPSALGAEAIAFSHSSNKREQSLELDEINAVSHIFNYLFVTPSGQIVLLALPKGTMTFHVGELIWPEVSISGSLLRGRKYVDKTLEFAAKHNIRPMIECFPLCKINKAPKYVDSGKPRYCVVLESD